MPDWLPPNPHDLRQPTLPGLFRQPTRRVLATPTEQALECARTRLVFFALLLVLVFLVIAARLMLLTVFNPHEPKPTTSHTSPISVGRADIVDRHGVILATSLPTFSACAQVKFIDDPLATAKAITGILPELDTARLAATFTKRKGCVPIKRHLSPNQHEALNRLGIGAIEFLRDERRIYPQGGAAVHVVGTTDVDNIGTSGIEKKFDSQLRDSANPLQLTLDIRVQHIMRHALQQAVTDFQAIGGAGMVMDVSTGAMLAMVSLPDFDPHDNGNSNDPARFNRATLGVYELGSTFKLFTAAQALEIGAINMTEKINTVDAIKVGRHKITDFHPENRWMTLPEIIMVSSNLGAARIAERIGGERQRAFLGQLGMFLPPPIELPEVGKPLVPSNWSNVTTMTVGFGHGIASAPLQLVRGVATLSNGGHLVKPTLLLAEDKTPAVPEPALISATTAAKMRAMMRLVVSAGTAKSANAQGYLVGGKTGTAEKISNKGYSKDSRLSSFIGVFPLSNPRYVIFVMLDEPKGNKKTYGFATGGWVAAPVVGQVVNAAAPLLGVTPMDSIRNAAADSRVLQPLGSRLINELVKPDAHAAEDSETALDDH